MPIAACLSWGRLLPLLGQILQGLLGCWCTAFHLPVVVHSLGYKLKASGRSAQERIRQLEAQRNTGGEATQTLQGQALDLGAVGAEAEATILAIAHSSTAASSRWSDHPLLSMPESKAPDPLISPCLDNCKL